MQEEYAAPAIRSSYLCAVPYLSNFDFLIDYRQRTLNFGGASPAGDRCRFETIGRYHGEPTTNRLLIEAEIINVSAGKVQLQCTRQSNPTLFRGSRVW